MTYYRIPYIFSADSTTGFSGTEGYLITVNEGVTVHVASGTAIYATGGENYRYDTAIAVDGTVINDDGYALVMNGGAIYSTYQQNSTVDRLMITIGATGSLGGKVGILSMAFGTVIRNAGTIQVENVGLEISAAKADFDNTGALISTAGTALRTGTNASEVVIRNSGTVSAVHSGFDVKGSSSTVSNTGTITSGDIGVYVGGASGRVFNSGQIGGANTGLYLGADATGTTVDNDHIIAGATAGVYSEAAGLSIDNSGTIEGGITLTGSNADLSLVNSGTVVGAVILLDRGDSITNSGRLDSVDLGGGDDIFDGTGGTVTGTVIGGAGDDLFILSSATLLSEAAGGGTDEVRASVSYTLSENFENLILLGAGDIDGTGNAADNILTGNAGDNRLSGGVGDDVLTGGAGVDTLTGGAGDDVYHVDNSADTVVEGASAGLDIVHSTASFTLAAEIERLILEGTAVRATGNTLANVLIGNASANVLDGRAGADRMTGGLGNDTYYVDNAKDVVVEDAGGGTDTIRSSVSLTLVDTVEQLVLEGTAARGTGNAAANRLTGNAAANVLDGGAGKDVIAGGAGDDLLIGGTGSDSLTGGAGNDAYQVDSALDVVREGAGGGVDTVYSTVSRTLAANIENLALQFTAVRATGNAGANTLTGNTADNSLDGAAGNDTLDAGGGDDMLVGGIGNDLLLGGLGDDRLKGGVGSDRLYGGTGDDSFVFDVAPQSANRDVVADFETMTGENDTIMLENAVFTRLRATGTLDADHFRVNSVALDANDYLVYDRATGALSYDADGNGRGAAVVLATFATRPALTADDFFVF